MYEIFSVKIPIYLNCSLHYQCPSSENKKSQSRVLHTSPTYFCEFRFGHGEEGSRGLALYMYDDLEIFWESAKEPIRSSYLVDHSKWHKQVKNVQYYIYVQFSHFTSSFMSCSMESQQEKKLSRISKISSQIAMKNRGGGGLITNLLMCCLKYFFPTKLLRQKKLFRNSFFLDRLQIDEESIYCECSINARQFCLHSIREQCKLCVYFKNTDIVKKIF